MALLVVVGCQPAAADAHTVRGVLVDVRGASLQRADSFTVRTDDGSEYTFVPAADFNKNVTHAMTPGHMRQHMALAEPITVTYREQNGNLIALSATD